VRQFRIPEAKLVIPESFIKGSSSGVVVGVSSAEAHPGIEVAAQDGVPVERNGVEHGEDFVVGEGPFRGEITAYNSKGMDTECQKVLGRDG
jgi:hypothetical protein